MSGVELPEDGIAKIGTLLEHLGSRFELVVEAAAGFDNRLSALRDEMRSQFAEVGRQIRFLCDQIGENQAGLASLNTELSAELIRIGEVLGAARVEFRQIVAETVSSSVAELQVPARPALREVTASSDNRAIEAVGSQLRTELKQTNKALSALSKKFDRFDDRVSVEVSDHNQRLRKLESGRRH